MRRLGDHGYMEPVQWRPGMRDSSEPAAILRILPLSKAALPLS